MRFVIMLVACTFYERLKKKRSLKSEKNATMGAMLFIELLFIIHIFHVYAVTAINFFEMKCVSFFN